MNKIRLIACGGAGINIATSIAESYNVKVRGLTEMEMTAIDTSAAEAGNVEKIGMQFIHIKSASIDSKELVGSGGRRGENAKHIATAVSSYLDSNPEILKANHNDFYILTTSLSGGTGSVIAPILAAKLLGLGHNVLMIGVSDTASEMQTLNSIETLNLCTLATKKSGRNLAMCNINNTDYDTLDSANAHATSIVITMGTFLSNDIVSIDPRDMAVLLDPSMLKDKFDIPKGIIEIQNYVGDVDELTDGVASIIHREIRNDRATTSSNALAYKRGELSGELLEYYESTELLPLSIRCLAGEIRNIKDGLDTKLESFKTITIKEDVCNEDDDMADLLG